MGHKVKQALISSRIDFSYYAFRNVLLVSIPLLVVCGVVLSHLSFHSSAMGSTSGSDNLAITISSSCTLSSVVNVPHNAEVYNGNYLGDIGKTTITTLCNDGNGYSVYAVGYSNNEEGNNKLINSEYPQYSIDTGLNTSGLTSQWAMKLNNIPDNPSPTPPTIESDYNNTYGIVPPYWTKVAGRVSGTTDMAKGSSFTTTYAVYASSSQYAGTYQGQVKYLLTHPNSNSQHLFMQDVDTWGNSVLANIGDSIQAIDIRDGKQYWVTRLADGNIWMTQNLDLDLVQNKTYTHLDTDLGWDSSDFDSGATWTLTTDPNWSTNKTTPYFVDNGDEYVYTSNSDANDIVYSSLTDCASAGHIDCAHYHLGNYYNWNAARANGNATTSICPAGWRLPDLNTNEFGNLLVDYNIITTNTSTSYLENGFNNIRKAPLYFIRGGGKGDVVSTDIAPGVSYGIYFYNNTTLYAGFMNFQSSMVRPILNNQYATIQGYGYSIRCVAR